MFGIGGLYWACDDQICGRRLMQDVNYLLAMIVCFSHRGEVSMLMLLLG